MRRETAATGPAIPLFRFLGSLRFALTLIGALALILSASTIFESVHGTPFAQKNFYTAHWFDFFLGLIWINIFCATWTRFPFKKRHIGFVITHIGILTLLAGSLITRLAGAEGQMTLYENQAKSEFIQPGFNLKISRLNQPDKQWALRSKSAKPSSPLVLEPSLVITEILEQAQETRYLIQSDTAPVNPAVHLELSSSLMGFNEKFTLISKNPDNTDTSSKEVGPARFILHPDTSKGPSVTLHIHKKGQKPFHANTTDLLAPITPLWDWGMTLHHFNYFPHAKIKDGQLINSPADTPFNPAVQFEIRDVQGKSEQHTKFLIFPEVGSIRGGAKANRFDLDVRLENTFSDPEEETQNKPLFHIYPSLDSPWRYEIFSSKGLLKKGTLSVGDTIETGWRDIHIHVKKMFSHGQIIKKISPSTTTQPGVFAVRITQSLTGRPSDHWLTENSPLEVRDSQGTPIHLQLEPVKVPLPFTLKLGDFRKVDYPGTNNPASFESDVTLTPATPSAPKDRTIAMNKPLDHAGWRIFQSSYIQDPELGEASVFTIAKNPGIPLIYGGGVIILIGVILLFYFHPFFNTSLKKD